VAPVSGRFARALRAGVNCVEIGAEAAVCRGGRLTSQCRSRLLYDDDERMTVIWTQMDWTTLMLRSGNTSAKHVQTSRHDESQCARDLCSRVSSLSLSLARAFALCLRNVL
jgi:hypothetical protein